MNIDKFAEQLAEENLNPTATPRSTRRRFMKTLAKMAGAGGAAAALVTIGAREASAAQQYCGSCRSPYCYQYSCINLGLQYPLDGYRWYYTGYTCYTVDGDYTYCSGGQCSYDTNHPGAHCTP